MSLAAVTLRLSHGRASASPGIGGTTGRCRWPRRRPVPAVRRRTDAVGALDLDDPLAGQPAVPRTSVIFLSSSHGTWPESSQWPAMESRQARAAATSIAPVTASAAPGTRRAAATTSPGPEQRLATACTPVGALAADQLPLHDGHRQTAVGAAAGGVLARRPGADHDDVEGVATASHPVPLVGPRPEGRQELAHHRGRDVADVEAPDDGDGGAELLEVGGAAAAAGEVGLEAGAPGGLHRPRRGTR